MNRKLLILVKLLYLLPLLSILTVYSEQAKNNQINDYVMTLFIDSSANWQPAIKPAISYPVDTRFSEVKGPVKKIFEKRVYSSGNSESVRLELYDKQHRITCIKTFEYCNNIIYTTSGRTENSVTPAWRWERKYDTANRLVFETGKVYKKEDRKWKETDRNSHKYDAAGREIASIFWSYNPSTKSVRTSSFSRRFLNGQLKELIEELGGKKTTSIYSYNSRNLVTSVTKKSSTGKTISKTSYDYTDDGRPLQMITADSTRHRQTAYLYKYENNRLVKREYYTWNYNLIKADGKSVTIKVKQSNVDAPLCLSTIYHYSADGRLDKISYLDRDSKPAWQYSPTTRFRSESAGPVYSYVTFEFVEGITQAVLHNSDGKIVNDSFLNSKLIANKTRKQEAKPKLLYQYDNHGNWIKSTCNGNKQIREISYY